MSDIKVDTKISFSHSHISNKVLLLYFIVMFLCNSLIKFYLIFWTKKRKISEFLDAGGYNRNERDRGIGELEWVDRERWRKKINLP